MAAVLRDSWIRAYKSLKTSQGLFQTGRRAYLDPSKIPPQDRDIHLVGFKFCPDTDPFPTLEAATAQHTNTITRLKTRSSRNPNRNNKVTANHLQVNWGGWYHLQ
eukprot:753890-Pelagomonas_calceolata.AAC.1